MVVKGLKKRRGRHVAKNYINPTRNNNMCTIHHFIVNISIKFSPLNGIIFVRFFFTLAQYHIKWVESLQHHSARCGGREQKKNRTQCKCV